MTWHFVPFWRRGVEHAARQHVADRVEEQVAAAVAPLLQLLQAHGVLDPAAARMLRGVSKAAQARLAPVVYTRLVQGVAAALVVEQEARTMHGYQPQAAAPMPPPPPAGPNLDVVEKVEQGLLKLGVLKGDARRLAASIPPGCTVEEGLKDALRRKGAPK